MTVLNSSANLWGSLVTFRNYGLKFTFSPGNIRNLGVIWMLRTLYFKELNLLIGPGEEKAGKDSEEKEVGGKD